MAIDRAVLNNLCNKATVRIESFTPIGLGMISWSLGSMRHKNLPLLKSICQRVGGIQFDKTHLTDQQLTNIIWCLGRLGWNEDEVFLQRIIGEIKERPNLDCQSIANLAWSIASLSCVNNDEIKKDLNAACEWVESSLLKKISNIRSPIIFKHGAWYGWEPQHISSVMRSMALLNKAKSVAFTNIPNLLSTENLGGPRWVEECWKTQQLANAFWSCAKVGVFNRCFAQILLKGLLKNKETFAELDVCQVLWACASLDIHVEDSSEVISAMIKKIKVWNADLSIHNIVEILWSIAKLAKKNKIVHHDEAVNVFIMLFDRINDIILRLSLLDISKVMWAAIALSSVVPPNNILFSWDLSSVLVDHLQRRPQQCREVAQLSWGVSNLHPFASTTWSEPILLSIAKWVESCSFNSMTPADVAMLARSFDRGGILQINSIARLHEFTIKNCKTMCFENLVEISSSFARLRSFSKCLADCIIDRVHTGQTRFIQFLVINKTECTSEFAIIQLMWAFSVGGHIEHLSKLLFLADKKLTVNSSSPVCE
eukprot:GHVL01044756.1.p1 GENE.GHVL01044756.1~~GHVL01044756.1.p1  ORF type:complete len:540 (-),score=44.07 GHVL01044756.1:1520-3139(-)